MRNVLSVAMTAAVLLGAVILPAEDARADATFVVNNRKANASDKNAGTEAQPLKTIQAGADRAQAGDTVLVRAGIYREEVAPPRGGSAADKPIIYRAAPGEDVSVRGSERIASWVDQGDGVWMAELDTAFFKGYNPFAMPVAGKWLFRGRDRRLGDVYCNGEALLQKMKIDEMRATPNTWYTDLKYGYKNKTDFPPERQYPKGKIQIWANFSKADPNKQLAEINARATGFFPKKSGLKYIVIDGFDVRHTAPQWGDIYTLEKGAIGMKYGYGWTIKNCTIAYSRNIGISMGVTDEVHFPRSDEGGLLEGGGNIPPMNTLGHHVIRNNVISRCGQTGIYSCYGSVGSVIEGNTITETNYRSEWFGTNQAAIKILFPIDVVIRNNLILGIPGLNNGAKGIWLDWGSQNTRVTGNIISDFANNRGLFLEVNFGPVIVDNNIFVRSSIVVESNGCVLAHNLFSDCTFQFMASPKRIVPYYKPHSTVRAGKTAVSLKHNRVFNNIIIGGEGFARKDLLRRNADGSGIMSDYNLFLAGAGSFPNKDANSIINDAKADLTLNNESGTYTLKFKLPPAAFKGGHPLITSKLIGPIPLANMPMEHPDGKPLNITTDYFAQPLISQDTKRKALPGPLQNIKPGENTFTIWPRKGK